MHYKKYIGDKMKDIIPQLIYLVLTLLGLGIALAEDGEPQSPTNFTRSFFVTVFILTLLTWGGFFDGLLGL